jgi:hypothetical protein
MNVRSPIFFEVAGVSVTPISSRVLERATSMSGSRSVAGRGRGHLPMPADMDSDILKLVALEIAAGLKPTRMTADDLATTDFADELKILELEQRLGPLLPEDAVERAKDHCLRGMLQAIDAVPDAPVAEDFVAAHARDGMKGIRTAMGRLKVKFLEEMRGSLLRIADGIAESESDE